MKYQRHTDSITKPPPFDRQLVKDILNPKTCFLVDSRLVRVEWLGRKRGNPYINLRVYLDPKTSIHFDFGRFYIRYAPWSKEDWAEAKREGRTGARNRNRRMAKLNGL